MKKKLMELIDSFREMDAPSDGRGWTEHLADHILANGVIVLPVKFGQTVFVICNTVERIKIKIETCIYETKIDHISIGARGPEFHLIYRCITHPDCDWFVEKDISKRVYSPDGLSPTIHTMGGGNQELKIMTEPCLVGGYGEMKSNGAGTFLVQKPKSPIRKLTERECWRLMDFDDAAFDRAKKALNETHYNGKDKSGTQMYKQAGNSIVVAVLEAIFRVMIGGKNG